MISRRELLAVGFAAMASRSLGLRQPQALPTAEVAGRTLPRFGIGAYPLGNLPTDEEGVAILHRAFDLGVRYIDTAPSYGGGRSERRVGLALESWLAANPASSRADFYIATKTLRRDGEGARRELRESLQRLRTSYVDAVQCHEVHDDFESLFGARAVVGELERARDEGLIRNIAITGHRDPAHLIAACTRYPFATALVPVNPIDVQHKSFVREFLPFAAERKLPVIAMKVFGGGFLLEMMDAEGRPAFSAADLLTYALAQPAVAIAVPGCDRIAHVEEDHRAIAAFAPPTPERLAAWEAAAGKHHGKSTEWYKDD